MLELNETPSDEPAVTRLEDAPDTEERIDVAGFGELLVVTTRLASALIGYSVRINNSAWAGYSAGYTTYASAGATQPPARWPADARCRCTALKA